MLVSLWFEVKSNDLEATNEPHLFDGETENQFGRVMT